MQVGNTQIKLNYLKILQNSENWFQIVRIGYELIRFIQNISKRSNSFQNYLKLALGYMINTKTCTSFELAEMNQRS